MLLRGPGGRCAQPAIDCDRVDCAHFLLRDRQKCQTAEGGRAGRRSTSTRSLCVPETVADILAAHRAGRTSPEETVARSYARIWAHPDPAIFIALREEAPAQAEARALAESGR